MYQSQNGKLMNCSALVHYDLRLTPCLCYVHRKTETGLYVEYILNSHQTNAYKQTKTTKKTRGDNMVPLCTSPVQ